jgi:hypothetical protein
MKFTGSKWNRIHSNISGIMVVASIGIVACGPLCYRFLLNPLLERLRGIEMQLEHDTAVYG